MTTWEVGVHEGPDNDADALRERSDADVMRASVADPARFQTLFERHFAMIFNYVGRRLGREAAEDVSAEVFLRAFEVRARYDLSYTDARPWLFGIAANIVRRWRRTEERRLRALARQPAEPAAAPDDPVSRLDSRATRPRLARALAGLRPDEREVLLLVAWAELTYDEVAVALGIPLGTVRSRLHRARARMSRELGLEEPGDSRGVAGAPGASDVLGARRIARVRSTQRTPHPTVTAPAPVAAKEDMPWTTSI
jgi:RNA polymerase sigma factor (sigma-70 family)